MKRFFYLEKSKEDAKADDDNQTVYPEESADEDGSYEKNIKKSLSQREVIKMSYSQYCLTRLFKSLCCCMLSCCEKKNGRCQRNLKKIQLVDAAREWL